MNDPLYMLYNIFLLWKYNLEIKNGVKYKWRIHEGTPPTYMQLQPTWAHDRFIIEYGIFKK